MAEFTVKWSIDARSDLKEILNFYILRNGNAVYSRKLKVKIEKSISKISKAPNIGLKTEFDSVRVLITGDYHIIYEIINSTILISMIWDCRRNPDDRIINKKG